MLSYEVYLKSLLCTTRMARNVHVLGNFQTFYFLEGVLPNFETAEELIGRAFESLQLLKKIISINKNKWKETMRKLCNATLTMTRYTSTLLSSYHGYTIHSNVSYAIHVHDDDVKKA